MKPLWLTPEAELDLTEAHLWYAPPQEEALSLCVRNKGCRDLELRKLYEQLPDKRGADEGYVRVIDESGADYLYPASQFVPVELPREA